VNAQRKPHPLKGRKQPPEAIAKRKATYAAKRAAKQALLEGKLEPEPRHNGHDSKDAQVYLSNALARWPQEKKRGIARLYVELALATLEGKA
jgi:hypothetical protein